MNEQEKIEHLNALEKDALQYNGEFMQLNEELLSEYLGLPYGDEVEGQSQAVSTDIQDVVEADMPSLARIFLGANDILEFHPNTDNPEEVKEAEEKTKYINWLVRKQPTSFKTIHDWIKSAEINKFGVVKYFVDKETKAQEKTYEGLSEDEITVLMEDLKQEADKVKVVSRDVNGEGKLATYSVRFRITKSRQKIIIKCVPLEDFLITRNFEAMQEAELVGDVCLKTRGQLIAEGYDEKKVAKLPTQNEETQGIRLKEVRFDSEGGYAKLTGKEKSEKVLVKNLYPLMDVDGDGIPERRNIIKVGDVILQDEPYDRAPYALMSALLMPNTGVGRSRAEITKPTQYIKTHLYRGTLDNMYQVNKPRIAIDDTTGAGGKPGVDLDDLLNHSSGSIIRCAGMPGEKLMPITIPYIGDQALQVIQYADAARAQSTGSLMASQGLKGDELYKETATRFEGVQDASQAKVELVARVYAETGFRDLFDGLCWLTQHYQDTQAEIMVLGKPLTVNPRDWEYDHCCSSNVGLGAGDDDMMAQNLGALLTIDQQLASMQSPLVDAKKVYNKLAKLVKGMGYPLVSEFYNDPEQPDQVLLAENEQLKAMLQELQGQMQNPLAEAEKIKAQAKLIVEEAKHEAEMQREEDKKQTELGKFLLQQAQQQEQFQRNLLQKQEEMMQNYALKVTELELKYQQGSQQQTEDIQGSLV
jgi:hypothetical protein